MPVFSPRAALWGGRGTVARPRGTRWQSGEPVPLGAYKNPIGIDDPMRRHDYQSVLNSKGIVTYTLLLVRDPIH